MERKNPKWNNHVIGKLIISLAIILKIVKQEFDSIHVIKFRSQLVNFHHLRNDKCLSVFREILQSIDMEPIVEIFSFLLAAVISTCFNQYDANSGSSVSLVCFLVRINLVKEINKNPDQVHLSLLFMTLLHCNEVFDSSSILFYHSIKIQ